MGFCTKLCFLLCSGLWLISLSLLLVSWAAHNKQSSDSNDMTLPAFSVHLAEFFSFCMLLAVLWNSTTEPFVMLSAELFICSDSAKCCFLCWCSSMKQSAPKWGNYWYCSALGVLQLKVLQSSHYMLFSVKIKDMAHDFLNNGDIILFSYQWKVEPPREFLRKLGCFAVILKGEVWAVHLNHAL